MNEVSLLNSMPGRRILFCGWIRWMLVLVWLWTGGIRTWGQYGFFDSVQVGNNGTTTGNTVANRADADTLDDGWMGVANGIWGNSNVFRVSSLTNSGSLEFGLGVTASVSLRNMSPSSLLGDPVTGGFLDTGASLQGGAPIPGSLFASTSSVFWNENAGSSANRNAVLFSFSQGIAGFGAWFGDMESSAAGTLAEVLLFDGTTNLLMQSFTSNASRRHNGAIFTDGNGNGNTRWLGFVHTNTLAVPNVRFALVIVGDSIAGGNAFGEHMSFIGPTVVVPEARGRGALVFTGLGIAAYWRGRRRKTNGGN